MKGRPGPAPPESGSKARRVVVGSRISRAGASAEFPSTPSTRLGPLSFSISGRRRGEVKAPGRPTAYVEVLTLSPRPPGRAPADRSFGLPPHAPHPSPPRPVSSFGTGPGDPLPRTQSPGPSPGQTRGHGASRGARGRRGCPGGGSAAPTIRNGTLRTVIWDKPVTSFSCTQQTNHQSPSFQL